MRLRILMLALRLKFAKDTFYTENFVETRVCMLHVTLVPRTSFFLCVLPCMLYVFRRFARKSVEL